MSDRCFVDIGTIGPVEEIAVDNSSEGKVYCASVFVCRIRLNIAIRITFEFYETGLRTYMRPIVTEGVAWSVGLLA